MKNTILFLLILAVGGPGTFAQNNENALEVSRLLYGDSLKRFEKEHFEKVANLGDRYVERLETVKNNYKMMGNLDGVLLVESEQSAVKAGGELPALGEEASSELSTVRKQYLQAMKVLQDDLDTQSAKLRSVYLSHLKILQSKLTRENRIDEALKVRDEVDRVEQAQPDPSTERAVATVSPEQRFDMEWGLPQRGRQVWVVTDGLQRKPNLIFDRDTQLTGDGILLKGGRVIVEGMDAELSNAVKETGEFTLRIAFIPENLRSWGPGRIISYSKGGKERNFTLGQQNKNLLLRIRTSETDLNGTNTELNLGDLIAGEETQVVFSYGPNGAVCFRDGKEVEIDDMVADLSSWEEMPLMMGNEFGTHRKWLGSILHFSLSNAALSPDEARKASQLNR
ncbi:hypothetical protein P0Y35_02485 [Kiritimatiellaeota bacterium B1221]|nr:hypothetical protein [Kiritimatiellaeota bacterium B1221]